MSEGASMDSVNLRRARTSDSWITPFTLRTYSRVRKERWVGECMCVCRAAVERAEQTSFVPIIALNQSNSLHRRLPQIFELCDLHIGKKCIFNVPNRNNPIAEHINKTATQQMLKLISFSLMPLHR